MLVTKKKTDMDKNGFFVDWNGDTRKVEAPGDGYSCEVVDCGAYLRVDVLDSEGFVCHEATYYQTLDALKAVGVEVRLVEGA